MADDSGRVALLWGPLILVAVLVTVFRFADPGEAGPESRSPREVPSSALPVGQPPGSGVTAPIPGGAPRAPDADFAPLPGYPAVPFAAGPAPYAGAPVCPPWAAYWPPNPLPRPGDRSSRYWGSGATEWGPPIGEYGPDTQVDPYWWAAAGEAER